MLPLALLPCFAFLFSHEVTDLRSLRTVIDARCEFNMSPPATELCSRAVSQFEWGPGKKRSTPCVRIPILRHPTFVTDASGAPKDTGWGRCARRVGQSKSPRETSEVRCGFNVPPARRHRPRVPHGRAHVLTLASPPDLYAPLFEARSPQNSPAVADSSENPKM